MRLRRTAIASTALALLAGPASGATVPPAAYALYTHLTGAMRKCWFSGDKAFSAYRYTPEVNAGIPRILLVSKKDPLGRPMLVVEPKGAERADAYGPLLTDKLSGRIVADLTRWLKGSSDCGEEREP